MTDIDTRIAEIAARAEAATPGPWHYRRDWVMFTDPDDGQVETIATTHESPDDARFIAHSRTDIPALLDTIAEMRGVIAAIVHDTAGWDIHGGEDYYVSADLVDRARALLEKMEDKREGGEQMSSSSTVEPANLTG